MIFYINKIIKATVVMKKIDYNTILIGFDCHLPNYDENIHRLNRKKEKLIHNY